MPSSEECSLTVYYVDEGCDGDSLLRAAMVAAHSLIVSNDIRRWVCVEAVACRGGSRLLLRVVGAVARGLAVQETALQGLLSSLLRGDKWPGIELREAPPAAAQPPNCTTVEEVLRKCSCPSCVVVREVPGFKPWWLAAAAMVRVDECCRRCR